MFAPVHAARSRRSYPPDQPNTHEPGGYHCADQLDVVEVEILAFDRGPYHGCQRHNRGGPPLTFSITSPLVSGPLGSDGTAADRKAFQAGSRYSSPLLVPMLFVGQQDGRVA